MFRRRKTSNGYILYRIDFLLPLRKEFLIFLLLPFLITTIHFYDHLKASVFSKNNVSHTSP